VIVAFVLVVFCTFDPIESHTYLSSVILNGQTLPEGQCVRPQRPGSDGSGIYRNSPVIDKTVFPQGLLGPNMTCGFLPWASEAADSKCNIDAGSQIGFQYYHNGPGASDDIIDPSHVGPVMAYMAKSDTGSGDVWFKIYEDGYNNGKWASTDVLKGNGGKVFVTIPSDISPGNYLLRAELIALHDGDKPHGSQPYVACVELTVSGSGNADPAGVSFPGAYKETDPGIAFNIYTTYNTYPIPGPAVYQVGTAPSSDDKESGGGGSHSKGLSSGGKAGIAIFIIALIAVGVIVGGIFLLKKMRPLTYDAIKFKVKSKLPGA